MSENRNRTNDRPLFILQYLLRYTDDDHRVYQHYISIKTRLINRLKAKKNANEREAELTSPKDETDC